MAATPDPPSLCPNCISCNPLQESGLLNRPEIPHLAGLNRPLLVKAYDLGLIDARGRTESRVIAEMLAAAEAQVHTCSALPCSLLRGLCCRQYEGHIPAISDESSNSTGVQIT
jgi:hypothetical protein